MQFFNPRLSTITLSVSMNKGTVQIAMAKTINPNFTGRPEKGQKIYDWENTVYFSLQPIECVLILENLNALLNGTYVNHKEKNDRFKKCITLTHFRNNQPSRLLIDRTKDQSGNPTGSMLISIIPPQDMGSPVTYAFRHEEMKLVSLYLDHGAKNLNFYKDVYDAIERITFAKRKKAQGDQTQGYHQSGQGGSNHDHSEYNNQQQATFDNTAQGQPDVPPDMSQQDMSQQDVENVKKIDLGW